MTKKRAKTNAMRMLEAREIAYVAHCFSAEIHSAQGVADEVGLPAAQVFKTLVAVPAKAPGEGVPLLAIVPGDRELALKKLARASGEKRLRMASQREAESLTGLRVGGISALALLHKGFEVFLDTSAKEYSEILISAGQRGINVQIAPDDLVKVTGAHVCPISRL